MSLKGFRLSQAGQEILSSTGLRVLAIVVAIGASVLVARLGGPEAKGVASTFAAVATMSFAITSLGVPEQVVQLTKTTTHGARRLLLKVWTAYAATATSVAIVLGIVLDVPSGLLVLGCLCYLVPMQAGFVTLGMAGVRAQALGALLQPLGLALAAVGFAIDGTLTGAEAALATALSYLLPMAVYWRAIPPDNTGATTTSVTAILRHGSKWQLPQVAQRLVQRSDILIVYTIFGPGQAGIYSVASQLSELCFTVTRQIAGQTYHHVVNDVAVILKRSIALATAASVVTAAGVGGVGFAAIVAVYGQDFADARIILLFLLPGPMLGSAALVLMDYYRARRTFAPSAASSTAGAVVAVVASFGLAPWLGVPGVAIGSTLGWAVYSAVSVYALRDRSHRGDTS